MKTEHTPGPWMRMLAYEANDKQPPYNVWNVIGNCDADERKQSVVATTITDDHDAALIAAAPELLEALESLTAVIANEDLTVTRKAGESFLSAYLAKARAAIAKAKGQP